MKKKTVEKEVVSGIFCDICGERCSKKVGNENWWFWTFSYDYSFFGKLFGLGEEWYMRTTVRMQYHDGDNIHEYDICPSCFKYKLEPWIESCGKSNTSELHSIDKQLEEQLVRYEKDTNKQN